MAVKHVFVFALVILLSIGALSALSLTKRSQKSSGSTNTSAEGTSQKKPEFCQGRTACGWGVYNRMTRNIEYFMRNDCGCSKDKKCLRDDDDISIAAYVYRCKAEDSGKTTS